MSRWSERGFLVGMAILVMGLAAVDAGLGGRERPILIPLLVAGTLILWLLTRRQSLAPRGWRRRDQDNDDMDDIAGPKT
jgi:hypothetical protein